MRGKERVCVCVCEREREKVCVCKREREERERVLHDNSKHVECDRVSK